MSDPHARTPAGRTRARGLGIPLAGRPGRWNAITDVPGLELGYATLIEGSDVRTGVTARSTRAGARAQETRGRPASTPRTATAR